MVFGRRIKPTPIQKIGRAIWPATGFRRSLRYLWHRVARLNDSAHRIALGFACGVFMSFSPLIGIHVAGAALLAWVLRGNILASTAGTAVGNPAVFPLIWVWIYKSGKFLLGENYLHGPPKPFVVADLWHRPIEALQPVLLPSMIGGTISGVVAAVLAYWLVRAAVSGYQARRRERMTRKRFVERAETGVYQAQQRFRAMTSGDPKGISR